MPFVFTRSHLRRVLCLVSLVACVSCGGPSEPDPPAEAVLASYAGLASQFYRDSLESARRLQEAVSVFVEDPLVETLESARESWVEARLDYGRTEALRFASGPIDGPGGPEALLNAWPLDESYIDGVPGAEDGGFLQDPDRVPILDADALIALNERGGEENVATGWHAIEFMLWGQDRSVDGPGERSVEDFVDARHAERRRAFLKVTTDLLLTHLEWLDDQWREATGGYRRELVATGGVDELRRIFSGLVEMTRGEIAGERLVVPYETRSQEDEQSCFSDTTTNDLVANIEGVAAVLMQGATPGAPSLLDFLEGRGADLAQVSATIQAARSAVGTIPGPLDASLGPEVPDSAPGRVAMAGAIERLEDLAMALDNAASKALGALPPPPE